jgi:hypothetical protein
MSITLEEGNFNHEMLGFSEIMVFLVVPDYRDCYRGAIIPSLDERRVGWRLWDLLWIDFTIC